MRIDPDEPVFQDSRGGGSQQSESDDSVPKRIRLLTETQRYAVLCTQGRGQPYGSLVAFAFSPDLRHAFFATLTSTRKYRLLTECNHVALVIDDRPETQPDLMEVQAITVTGTAEKVGEDDGLQAAALLLDRHPYLDAFVRAPSCALFRVQVFRYFYVTRFQEVHEWTPPRDS